MPLSSDFISFSSEAAPWLYRRDMLFACELHSVPFWTLSDGQQPISPVPTNANFLAPRLYIVCNKNIKFKYMSSTHIKFKFVPESHNPGQCLNPSPSSRNVSEIVSVPPKNHNWITSIYNIKRPKDEHSHSINTFNCPRNVVIMESTSCWGVFPLLDLVYARMSLLPIIKENMDLDMWSWACALPNCWTKSVYTEVK